MLKWAVTPRPNGEVFEHDGNEELSTLQAIIGQHKLPCLIRLVNNDINNSIDNYCILLCETNDPYLILSNETKQFSIPISFDGLFARVEHGVTRYNIVQSIHSLQSHLKSSSSFPYTHFTTLQPYMAYNNSSLCRIDPGTLLEPCHGQSRPTSSLSSSSIRLRTLFASLPHSLNKHLLSTHQQKRSIKKQISPNEHFEVKSNLHDDIFTLKSDSIGIFVPVYTQLPSTNSHNRSSHLPYSPDQIQGLYTTHLLSQLTDQYPLTTDLVVSRTLEEQVSTTNGYPFRRITCHRFVENHPRIIAFDVKNYTFIEIDRKNPMNMYFIKHKNTLSQRYQAELRWCHKHLSLYRQQIKTIVQSSNDTTMFIQTTLYHREQSQEYSHRRNSSSILPSPLVKHPPKIVYTSQESISPNRLYTQNPSVSKFFTISNPSKYEEKQQHKQTTRKNVRVHFNDSTIERHLQSKHSSVNKKHSNNRINTTQSGKIDRDEENENSLQSTAL